MNQRRQRRFVPDRLTARTQRLWDEVQQQQPAPQQGQQGGEPPWPPPKELARFETAGERRRRKLAGVVLLLVGLFLALLAWTGSSWARSYHGDAAAHEEHSYQAVVTSCDRNGPISRFGLGYWWDCKTDVQGDPDTVTLHGSELTPDDIGKTVAVYGETNGSPHSTIYYRAVEHPLRGLGLVLVVVAGLLLFAFGGAALLRLLPQESRYDLDKKFAAKLRERYRAERRF